MPVTFSIILTGKQITLSDEEKLGVITQKASRMGIAADNFMYEVRGEDVLYVYNWHTLRFEARQKGN